MSGRVKGSMVRTQGYGEFVPPEVSARIRRFIAAVGYASAPVRLRTSEPTLEALRDGGRVRPHVLERILAALDKEEAHLAAIAS